MDCWVVSLANDLPCLPAWFFLEGSKVFPHRKKEGTKNKARKAGTPEEGLMPLRGQMSTPPANPAWSSDHAGHECTQIISR